MPLTDRIAAARKIEDLFQRYSASLRVIEAYGSTFRGVLENFCEAMSVKGNGSAQQLESARNALQNVLKKNKFESAEVFGGLHLLESGLAEIAQQYPDAGALETGRLSKAIGDFSKSLDDALFNSQRPDFILRTVRDAHTLSIQLNDLRVWSGLLARTLGDGEPDADSRELLIQLEVTSTVEVSVDVLREIQGLYDAITKLLHGAPKQPLLLKSAFTGSLTVVISGSSIAIALLAKYLIQALPEMTLLAAEGKESRQIRSRFLLVQGLVEMKDELSKSGVNTEELESEIEATALELGRRARKLADQSDAVIIDGDRVMTNKGEKLLNPPEADSST